MERRSFVKKTIGAGLAISAAQLVSPSCKTADHRDQSPVDCAYAPCSEYIKDHSFIFHDGWYHLFSISGTEGFYHGYTGNEETISWSISIDLIHWTPKGICAEFPHLTGSENFGATTHDFKKWGFNSAESLTVMKHPLNGKWIMLGNWQYLDSDNPFTFDSSSGGIYNIDFEGKITDLGFAGEMVFHNGKWYRSGVFGKRDHWKLGFTEIEWSADGAFTIVRPSIMST